MNQTEEPTTGARCPDALLIEAVREFVAANRALARGGELLIRHVEARVAEQATPNEGREEVTVIYTRKDMARILKCSASTVDDLVRDGVLPYTRRRPGGDRCFLPEHLEQYKRHLHEQTKVRRAD
jgi:excisionase family DNA binding protein